MPNLSNNLCDKLHSWANKLKIFSFPYDESKIPLNGVYLLFEKGEKGHSDHRIVRIGTHTGKDQLRSRLRQHFLTENKDRSIFRKNIGRCFLNKTHDPYLKMWELDMTAKSARDKYGKLIDIKKQKAIEKKITEYMRKNFFFGVIKIDDKRERLDLESKIISTVSHCNICGPSKNWLGNYSPKEKIVKSGLWLVNELYKSVLLKKDLEKLKKLKMGTRR